MSGKDLEQRVLALEASEDIRTLKARYLASCDAKQPHQVRACFADGPVAIDYGAVGRFECADDLVAVYRQIACHPHMLEMHHGVNPQLKVLDAGNARGEWDAHYQLINTQDMTLTQLGGHYWDEYRRTGQGWKISATRFEVHSALVVELGDSSLRRLVASRKMP